MKWIVEYGMCDGTGPYTKTVEGNNIMEAGINSSAGWANIMSINPAVETVESETKTANGKMTFDAWIEKNCETGKFKFIAENIIRWIEETR